MNTKPIWLLDVDGEINAIVRPYQFPKAWPKESWSFVECAGFPIQYSSHVVDFINKASEKVEIRWHSTWSALHEIDKIEKALGFKHFESSSGSLSDGMEMFWWKMPYALDVVDQEKRPLIWTDDDLIKYERQKFYQKRLDDDLPALLIRTTPSTGLVANEFERINKFIDTNVQQNKK